MNIVIYARYSSDKQTENSIEGQLKVCYEFAQQNNYTIIGEYIDRALTGTSDKRPEFQRMIEDSKKKQFEGVLVYQLDRFSRDKYDNAIYKQKLRQNGVKVISAKENISDEPEGLILESVLEGMAAYYSKELSRKVKRGMRLNAEKGLYTGSQVPLGFKIVDKKYIIDEQNAVIVREIFTQYSKGKTYVEIVNYLNEKQFKTAYGKPFAKNSLYNILQNKKYIGIYFYDDIEIKDAIPRIVSDELFFKVQAILENNKKVRARTKADEEYLLTTKLFCGYCKNMMVGYCGTSRTGKKHYYYSCKSAMKKTCNKKQAQKQWLEDLVINKCYKILTDENIEMIAKEAVKASESSSYSQLLKLLINKLKEYEKEQANLLQAVAECPMESVRQGIYDKLSEVMQNKKDIETQLAIENNKVGGKLNEEQIIFFLTKLKNGDPNDIYNRKALIAVFVIAIYLYDEPERNKKITFVLNVNGKPFEITEEILSDIEKFSLGGSYNKTTSEPRKLVRGT